MEFEFLNDRNLLRTDKLFLWKAAGVNQYENEFDHTISHLFKRLIKEMNYSFEKNDTNERIYTFAYKKAPSTNWNKGLDVIKKYDKQYREFNIIFTPTKNAINDWINTNEDRVDRFIEENIPVNIKKPDIWKENPTWSNIKPGIEQLTSNRNKIPNEWWIWYSQDVNYYGFVLKDLVYYPHNKNLFIDFREYEDFLSGNPLTGPSQNFAILKNNMNFERKKSIRVQVPIIASAKIISPYIVQFFKQK